MVSNNLFLYDDKFENKLNELRKRFRSRMNGKTTEQMQNGQISYKENYGASLQHIKELAQEMSFTPNEYSLLWRTNIREAMLISAINYPDEFTSAEEMTSWAKTICTADMAEQASFFLFYRCHDVDHFITNILQETTTYTLTIATFTAGRAIAKGRQLSDNTYRTLTDIILSTTSISSSEARGISLFLRQLCKITAYVDTVKSLADIYSKRSDSMSKQISFEVINEIEMPL